MSKANTDKTQYLTHTLSHTSNKLKVEIRHKHEIDNWAFILVCLVLWVGGRYLEATLDRLGYPQAGGIAVFQDNEQSEQ